MMPKEPNVQVSDTTKAQSGEGRWSTKKVFSMKQEETPTKSDMKKSDIIHFQRASSSSA